MPFRLLLWQDKKKRMNLVQWFVVRAMFQGDQDRQAFVAPFHNKDECLELTRYQRAVSVLVSGALFQGRRVVTLLGIGLRYQLE